MMMGIPKQIVVRGLNSCQSIGTKQFTYPCDLASNEIHHWHDQNVDTKFTSSNLKFLYATTFQMTRSSARHDQCFLITVDPYRNAKCQKKN